MILKNLNIDQFHQVNQLWNEEFPLKLKDRFSLFLADIKVNNHYIIESKNKEILAWAIDFEREQETWFSIIVNADQQGNGLGKLLLNRLKRDLDVFYGWVIDHNRFKKKNGENYRSPLSFYIKEGFELLSYNNIDNNVLKAVKIEYNASNDL